MASRDLMNQIHTVPLFPPVAAATTNAAIVSSIIDTAGYEGVTFVLVTGGETDADATFAVTVDHSDASNLAGSTAAAASDLIGSLALASFNFADDNETRKLGYIGSKRYVRVTVTPSLNDAGNIFLAGVAILGFGKNNPQNNPPQ